MRCHPLAFMSSFCESVHATAACRTCVIPRRGISAQRDAQTRFLAARSSECTILRTSRWAPSALGLVCVARERKGRSLVSATEQQMNLAAARTAAVHAIDDVAVDLVRLSKFIHANPEIAMEEIRSSAACADFLETRGF